MQALSGYTCTSDCRHRARLMRVAVGRGYRPLLKIQRELVFSIWGIDTPGAETWGINPQANHDTLSVTLLAKLQPVDARERHMDRLDAAPNNVTRAHDVNG